MSYSPLNGYSRSSFLTVTLFLLEGLINLLLQESCHVLYVLLLSSQQPVFYVPLDDLNLSHFCTVTSLVLLTLFLGYPALLRQNLVGLITMVVK